MRVLNEDEMVADPRGSVITIGVYDGVHRGHCEVLARVVEESRQRSLAATVVTFNPLPAQVLDPEHAPGQLESLERRLARFSLLGVDQVRVVSFDEAASRESADSFVERVLVRELSARHVIVGEDFHFGRDRAGNAEMLASLGATHGFTVTTVAPVGNGERFSSTMARSLIERDDLEGAERVLGHHVVISAEVVHGDARGGNELGYPTANLALEAKYVRPGNGIYAGAARTSDGRWFAAAVSIGQRPQFYENGSIQIEAHLIDFDGDLYGRALDLVLIRHLRAEAKFDSVDALVAQIGLDVASASEIFGNFSHNPDSLLGFVPGQRR